MEVIIMKEKIVLSLVLVIVLSLSVTVYANNSYSLKEGYSDGEYIITKNGDDWTTIKVKWDDSEEKYTINVYNGGIYWYYSPEAKEMVGDGKSHHADNLSKAITKAANIYIKNHGD